jgi:hypothetical protein
VQRKGNEAPESGTNPHSPRRELSGHLEQSVGCRPGLAGCIADAGKPVRYSDGMGGERPRKETYDANEHAAPQELE